MLAADGLLEVEAERSARVSHSDSKEVEVLYRMREQVEPPALTERMPQHGEADFEHPEQIQVRFEAGIDVPTSLELDREFHLLTYLRCPTDQLGDSVTRLWNSTTPCWRVCVVITGAQRMRIVNAEHRPLLEALTSQDADDVERYLVETSIELGKN